MAGKPFVGTMKILLEGRPLDSCPMLNQAQVHQIPPKLSKVILSRESVKEDLGDMGTVVRVKDEKYYDPLMRTFKWITRGAAADFLTPRKFDVIKKEGDRRVIRFDSSAHADDARYTMTESTRTCFVEDIDQYIFSIEYEIADLQEHISKKLCLYPVYASEIVMLMKALYSINSKAAHHVDPDLANFLANRIQCFRHALIADDGVLAALRACISPKMELEHLSRHTSISSETVDAALHALHNAIGEPNTAGALLQIFERKHLSSAPPSREPSVPSRPPHSRRTSEDPLHDHTADAIATLSTIGERRLVRAEQDGSGTLRSNGDRRFSLPANIRNEGFRIARGQYLVLLPEQRPQVLGATARVVCNESGEIGELFENLRLTPVQETQIPPPPPQKGDGSKRPRIQG